MRPVNRKAFLGAEYHVFRRWTRNAYAVFVSMKKQVKISCLRLTYGKLVELKGYMFTHFEFVNYTNRDNCDDEDLEALLLLMQTMQTSNHYCTKEITASGIFSFRGYQLSHFLTKGK